MKKQILIFVCMCFAMPAMCASDTHKYYEKDYQNIWCSQNNGKTEVVLPDLARVDCVTNTHAIEFDFAKKWGESIGQALYYSAVLNKKAGIVLILENGEKDKRYLERVQCVAKLYNISVWTMTDADMQKFGINDSYPVRLKK